jgi:hypothetical protein
MAVRLDRKATRNPQLHMVPNVSPLVQPWRELAFRALKNHFAETVFYKLKD